MGVRKTVHRAVNVFVGVGFEMMVTMVAHPHHGVSCQDHRRPGGKDEFEPFRHLKTAVGQIAMQIKCSADSAPKKEREHDRQIGNVEASQESDHSEQLQRNQGDEDEKI